MLAEAAADPPPAAVLGHHIAGVGHMGAESAGVGPQVVGAHQHAGGIHGHHHRLALLHPGQLGLGLADGRVVGEGFTSAEHRLQQGPHRRPVGCLVGPDLQGRGGRGQGQAARGVDCLVQLPGGGHAPQAPCAASCRSLLFCSTQRDELDLLAAQLDLELIAGLQAQLGGIGLADQQIAVELHLGGKCEPPAKRTGAEIARSRCTFT